MIDLKEFMSTLSTAGAFTAVHMENLLTESGSVLAGVLVLILFLARFPEMFTPSLEFAKLFSVLKSINSLVLSICFGIVITVLLALLDVFRVFPDTLVIIVFTLSLCSLVLVGHKSSCPTLTRTKRKNYSYFALPPGGGGGFKPETVVP
jgi:hypothetical protein